MNKNFKSKLFDIVCAFADAHTLIPHNSSIVVGFSGGPDSVFLLHTLNAMRAVRNLTLYAAHLNHEWRSAEADEDAAFCRAMAAELDIPFITMRLSELSPQPSYDGSREAQGRAARRQFLTMVQRKTNADFIALAHHADDQQETFFIRLTRGASLSGLTGMSPQTDQYIRPLLSIHKNQILDFLHEQKIPYHTDSSNDQPDYLRNRIRATVIPALRAADTRFDQTYMQTLTRLQETEEFLERLTVETFASLQENNHSMLNLEKFKTLHAILQERILMHWLCLNKAPFTPTYSFLQEVLRFIRSPRGGTHALHNTWHLTKQRNKLAIEAKKEKA